MMIAPGYLSLFRQVHRNKTIKATLYLLVVAVLASVVEVGIWAFAKVENSQLRADIETKRAVFYNHEQLTKLNAHLEKTRPLIDAVEKKYKSNTSQSEIMRLIDGLMRRHNLRVTAQTFQRSDENGIASVSVIEMRVTGSYTDIRRMLGNLPELPAWIEVADVNIEQIGDARGGISGQIRLLAIKERAQ